jgi:hypothetical protein
MHGTDLRLPFMALAVTALAGLGFVNAYLLRRDYDAAAAAMNSEITQIYAVAAKMPGRRIVLAGGSNTVFGVDADVIARETGIPTVNAGMRSMLGSETNYIDFLTPMIRPGDIVLYSNSNWMVSPTAHQIREAALDGNRVASSLSHVGAIRYREGENSVWPSWTLFPRRPMLAYLVQRGGPIIPTERDALGDALHCPIEPPLRQPLAPPHGDPPAAMFAGTQDLAARVRARGATLIFAEPWVLVRRDHLASWLRYRDRLREQLARIALLLPSAASDVLHTDERLFCDSPLHLQAEGRDVRTRHLLTRLAPALSSSL